MPIRIWAWNKENKGLFAAANVLRLLFCLCKIVNENEGEGKRNSA